MKRLLTCAFVLTFILAGCGSTNEETVCKVKKGNDDALETINTIEYKDDVVSKLVIENNFDLSNGEVKKSEIDDYAKEIKKLYNEVDGVSYEYESTEDKFSEKVKIDLNEKTIKKIKEAGILPQYIGEKDEKVDAKKIIKQMKESGMDCK